jgi:hypothetical protein
LISGLYLYTSYVPQITVSSLKIHRENRGVQNFFAPQKAHENYAQQG